MTEYLRIGKIVRPHGIKGAVKLEPSTSDNSRFSALSDAFIETNGAYKPCKVISASCSHTEVILQIEGVSDRNAAEALRGKFICVDRAHAVPLPEGRYFIADLIGCKVYDSEGEYLGVLHDVMERPANDVYEIRKQGCTLLVPALKKLLASVDVAAKNIILDKETLDEVGLFEKDGEKV